MTNTGDMTGGGAFPPPVPQSQARAGNGRLTAAGVLQIIEGAVAAVFGLWLFTATQSDVGGIVDELSGDAFTFAAILFVAFGAVLIWTGVSCIKGRKWGWTTVIVFQSIFLLSGLGNLVDPETAGNGVIEVAYFAAALYLAVTGGMQSQRQ